MITNCQSFINTKPYKVKFTDIQKAIIIANKVPPECKKIAWNNVYKLSEQYKIQEDFYNNAKIDFDFNINIKSEEEIEK